MNLRFIPGIAALLCAVFASCYPIGDNQIKQQTAPPQQPQAFTQEQLQQKQAEDQKVKAAEDELRRQQANLDNKQSPSTTPATSDYPFASKVPGKEGFVFSPYNNKVVDVRDIPTGTLVQDPTYPASEKKYFRVP